MSSAFFIHPAFIVPVALTGFVLFWMAIAKLLGAMSGWKAMHARFGLPPGQVVPRSALASGRVGLVNYNNVLRVGCDQVGMYLSVLVFFRAGHPPLFIPWNEVHEVERKDFLWRERVRFSVGHPRITAITLPASLFPGTPLDLHP